MVAGGPRIAVVIPTKNAGPRFERTLEAIASQGLGEPFETIVIDSGSTDGTLGHCRAQRATRPSRSAVGSMLRSLCKTPSPRTSIGCRVWWRRSMAILTRRAPTPGTCPMGAQDSSRAT